MILKDELINMGFVRAGSIILTDNYPQFDWEALTDTKCGFVYMWIVEKNKIPVEVLYIGKAGFTLTKRGKEHYNGFKRSKSTGETLATKLRERLTTSVKEGEEQTTIGIYARHSQCISIFEQPEISMCEIEETALIKKYEKRFTLYNSQKKSRQQRSS